ncbi:MAG: hypothetical protein AAB849_02220 [Patescibacteria group bacterium]
MKREPKRYRVWLGKQRQSPKRRDPMAPWETDRGADGPFTLESCPRAGLWQRLPDNVYNRLPELAEPGVIVYVKAESSYSGDVEMATRRFLNWTGEGTRWIVFADGGFGAAWKHPAWLYVFLSGRGRGRKIRCDCPPDQLYNTETWTIFN